MSESSKLEIAAIEARARELGLRKGNLHRVAKVDVSTWWRWRNGSGEPAPEALKRVRDYLDEVAKVSPNTVRT